MSVGIQRGVKVALDEEEEEKKKKGVDGPLRICTHKQLAPLCLSTFLKNLLYHNLTIDTI